MRILQVASEAFPFCKTGGLADVVGTLSRKLAAAGHEVELFLPRYRGSDAAALRGARARTLSIPWGSDTVRVDMLGVRRGPLAVRFLDCPALFGREGIYGVGGRDYADNDARFAVLSRAALEGAKAEGFRPDIVHLHDWQTALAAVYLRTLYRDEPCFARAASVLTVHNIAYQGKFPARSFARAGFAARGRAALSGGFLKAGLAHADWLNTVSPTYAREILTPKGGLGMEGVLRRRRARLSGILNGIDLDCWDPERDLLLPRRYGPRDPAGKAECKRRLLAACGLAADDGTPLLGMVARLDRQKGWDIALQAVAARPGRCRFVAMGEGDPRLAAAAARLQARQGRTVRFHSGYSEELAHRLYAGADMLLMPSRFEPCGLGQMIAMRYGCVPVAARTGGLADTVVESGPRANGFTARAADPRDFGLALDRALDAYASPGWDRLRRAGMRADFSWDRSLRLYLGLYRRASAGA